ncbi:MAG TPA: Glu/Leu/Phe/Val dehydrogenase dimerization domain-containing protein [Candidatus Saccharimonadales bacterium]
MIEAVQRRIETNARRLFTPDEIGELYAPEQVNEYARSTEMGPIVAARTQHRLGEDGSGGGFKIVEAPRNLTALEMRRLTREQSLGLGTLMTLKGDLVHLDLPGGHGNDFGGAKGVMMVPEGMLSNRKAMNTILGDYVAEQYAKGALGIGIDRHAPDMNTGAPDMDHMARTLRRITGDERSIAAFSGKSIEAGGLEGREIATAQGLVFTLAKHLETLDMNSSEATVAVQGSGNVGYHFARLASEQLGVKIVGISDRNRAVVTDKAHPIRMDETVRFENRLISSWDEDQHGSFANPDDLLGMDVDILVFAAMPDTVTEEKGNKEKIRAKVILQGANNPMDGEAIDYLIDNRVSVVADVLGNAGGFVASNFEYNQGMTGTHWTERMAIASLRSVMDDAYDRVRDEAENIYDFTNPAFQVALKRRYERDHSGLYLAS